MKLSEHEIRINLSGLGVMKIVFLRLDEERWLTGRICGWNSQKVHTSQHIRVHWIDLYNVSH